MMANRHVTALERDKSPLVVFGNNTARKKLKSLGLGAYQSRQHRINPPDIHWESRMKIWQILLVIWVVAGCFMLANYFHRENIERDKKR